MDVLVTFDNGEEENFYGIKKVETIPDMAGDKVRLYKDEDTTYIEFKMMDVQYFFCEFN